MSSITAATALVASSVILIAVALLCLHVVVGHICRIQKQQEQRITDLEKGARIQGEKPRLASGENSGSEGEVK